MRFAKAASPAPSGRCGPPRTRRANRPRGAALAADGWGCGSRQRMTAHSGRGRVGVETHEPGGVDDRRDARLELGNEPDGAPYKCRGTADRGAVARYL